MWLGETPEDFPGAPLTYEENVEENSSVMNAESISMLCKQANCFKITNISLPCSLLYIWCYDLPVLYEISGESYAFSAAY